MTAALRAAALALGLASGGCGGADPDPVVPTGGAGIDAAAVDLPPDASLAERLEPELAGALAEARAAALAAAPDDHGPLLHLARLFEVHALPAQAAEVYAELLRRAPDQGRARFHLALCRYELGDVDAALADLRAAVAAAPERSPGHWRLGLWLGEAGDLEGAREAFDAARAADPDDASGYLGAARAELDLGDASRAVDLLESGPPGLLERPYARHLLARALAATGRTGDADRMRPEGESFHDWYDPWVAELDELRVGRGADLGEALDAIRAGQPERAVELLSALLSERPDDVTIQGMLAAAHASLGQPEAALPMLEAAAERQPRHYRIALNRSINLQAAGRLPEALAQAERAVDLHPDHAASRYQLARLQEAAGATDSAIESYRAALRLGFERRRVAPRMVRLGVRPEEVGP